MTGQTAPAITELLKFWSARSPSVESALFEAVYDRLLEIATHLLRRERAGHTLEPPGLVHEAFLRLVDQRRASWRSREQFFATSATTMRRVLADHGRRKKAVKRGGGEAHVSLEEQLLPVDTPNASLEAVQESLAALRSLHPRWAEIVELRFFGGLTLDETAVVLHRSRTSIVAEWASARDWLALHL